MSRLGLDDTSMAILKDILERFLIAGRFVNADDYRVAKNEVRPLIDKLERRRLIVREGQAQSEYRVTLLSLVALDNDDAKIELGRCADIFRVLQTHYRHAETRPKQKFLSELGKELELTDVQVRNAVMFLKDSGHWIAGGSSELSPPERAWIRPNEYILNYDSFDDLLQELVDNSAFRVIEPIGVTDPRAQSQRALELLARVRAGERSFQPSSQSQADIEPFQDVARDLDWLFRQGYLQSFKPLRESQSGARRIVVVQVGDLTYEGVLYLEHLRSSTNSDAASEPSSPQSHEDKSAKQTRSALHPWPVIRGLLLEFDSYDVPRIVDRAGLTVDWQLSERDNYSDKIRLTAYRGRIDKAFQDLPTEEDRLRVAHIVAREISERGRGDELNRALRDIGWEVRQGGLVPAVEDVRELFFGNRSEHDAYVEIRALLQRATKVLTIVDPYIDQSILTLVSTCAKPGMSIQLLTTKTPNDFVLEGKKWTTQYENVTLEVRTTKEFHDRFIILDETTCWHVGASIKDAGRKAFMLSQIEDESNRAALISQLKRSWTSGAVVVP